jgi:hypothetical protein
MKVFQFTRCGLFATALFLSTQSWAQLSLAPEISRSRSLYDRSDGKRKDGMDYTLAAALKTDVGTFAVKGSYAQNLNDSSPEENDFADLAANYSMNAFEFDFLKSFDLKMVPGLTAIIPIAKNSKKNEKLQTALVASLGYSLSPKALSALSLNLGFTAGHNFHEFDVDENGKILNKYSSNQSIGVSYAISKVSLSLNYTHKNRWTYQNVMREGFDLSQKATMTFIPEFYVSLGHTNSGSAVRPNGYESNISFIDDDNSLIYITVGSNLTF